MIVLTVLIRIDIQCLDQIQLDRCSTQDQKLYFWFRNEWGKRKCGSRWMWVQGIDTSVENV